MSTTKMALVLNMPTIWVRKGEKTRWRGCPSVVNLKR